MITEDLEYKEHKSISIIKETVTKFKKPIVMFSLGKDSTVLLHLIKKAFGKIPFDVGFIDNGVEFKESYTFLKDKQKELGFNLVIEKSILPENYQKDGNCCSYNKIDALKKLEQKYDVLFVAIRRDENPARADEKEFNKKRVHPILDWTELDIWNYIKENKIKVNPLYFAKDGQRYRSLGCSFCSASINSNAKTIPDIIKEISCSSENERASRNAEKEKIMKKLRDLGYM
jgi:sulfate adenylyltransferase subunit 2